MSQHPEHTRARVVNALSNHPHRDTWYPAELARHCRCSTGQLGPMLDRMISDGVVGSEVEEDTGRTVYYWLEEA